jgi:hypothetical protein
MQDAVDYIGATLELLATDKMNEVIPMLSEMMIERPGANWDFIGKHMAKKWGVKKYEKMLAMVCSENGLSPDDFGLERTIMEIEF